MRTEKDRESVVDQLWQQGVQDVYDLARSCSFEPAFSDYNPGSTVIFITTHLAIKRLRPTVRPPEERLMLQASGG